MAKAYTQSSSYIPATDAAFRDWLDNFSTLISADPGKYGLDASDAAVIANHFNDYNAAYQVVQAPSTRTSGAIAQKDALKASAIGSVRVYAQMIKTNVGVDNQDKIDLGLHVNDPTPTPIPQPDTAPLLMIQAGFSGEHVIRYADENTPASRRKPHGAIQIQINRTIAVGADPNPENATLVGLYTKQPVLAMAQPGDVGKTATYFGRWVTRTGLFGPWSLPVAMTIAFGGPVDQNLVLPTGGGTPEEFQAKIAA